MAADSRSHFHEGNPFLPSAMHRGSSSGSPPTIRIKDDPDDISHSPDLRFGSERQSTDPTLLHSAVQQTQMFNPNYHRQYPQGFAMQDIVNALDDSLAAMIDHPSPESDAQSLDDNDSMFSSASPPDAYDGPLPPQEETERYLQLTLNIAPPQPVNLTALPENPWPPGITRMIKLAIWGSQRKMLTLSQIYEEIENRFPSKRSGKDAPWKKSIRHNLSLKSVFVKVERPANHPGKGCYWALDFRQGEGDKRPRSRKVKEAQSPVRFNPEEGHLLYGSSRGPHASYGGPVPPYLPPHQLFGSPSLLPGPQEYYYSQTGSNLGQPGYGSKSPMAYSVKAGPPLATGPQMWWQPTISSAQPANVNPAATQGGHGMLYPGYGGQPNVKHYSRQGPQIPPYPYQGGHPVASSSTHGLQTTGNPHVPGPLPRSYSYGHYEEDPKEDPTTSRRHRTY